MSSPQTVWECNSVMCCQGCRKTLRPIARELARDDRPKEFGAVLHSETFLVQASELTTFPILQGGNTRCVTTH
jgi:hypothetical protein